MKMEKVKILLSTYNGERFLGEQIESLISQENVLIDILIRDDGSSDNTINILDKYQKRGKIKYYNGKNLKPARSFVDLVKIVIIVIGTPFVTKMMFGIMISYIKLLKN